MAVAEGVQDTSVLPLPLERLIDMALQGGDQVFGFWAEVPDDHHGG